MVKGSKRPPARPRVTLHELAVLLKTQNSEFRGFGEALKSVDAHVQSVEAHVHRLDAHVQALDARVEGVAAHVQALDARVEGVAAHVQSLDAHVQSVDARLGRVEHDIVLIKDAVMENTRELKRVWVAVDKKVDRDEVEAIAEGVLRRGA
jgi:chromosome segregation ATPase